MACSSIVSLFCIIPLLFGALFQVKCNTTKSPLQDYPFHAYVEGKQWGCTGILISEYYVISLASCLNGSSQATVYLGFLKCPYGISKQPEKGTQIIHSNEVTIHEDFSHINGGRYSNNIALIKLSLPAKLSKIIQPGLIDIGTEQDKLERLLVRLSGWKIKDSNSTLSSITLNLLSREMCEKILDKDFIKSQEVCAERNDSQAHLYLLGNPSILKGKITGILTESPNYKNHLIFLDLRSFLDWITWHTHIDKTKLTGAERDENEKTQIFRNAVFEKMERLSKQCKEIKTRETEIIVEHIEQKIENNIKEISRRLEDITTAIEEAYQRLNNKLILIENMLKVPVN